jgi:hypothetical protein
MVGPGIQQLGVDNNAWSDHTDIRPTMLELLGLKDDYSHDGRVLFEVLKDAALPAIIRENRAFFTQLAQVYKQINAPVGALGLASLQVSTLALASNASNDSTYTSLENQLRALNNTRNVVAGQIIALLKQANLVVVAMLRLLVTSL